jgi:hypothetical protein
MLLGYSLRYLPGKYARGLWSFTVRFVLALTLAALPGLLWQILIELSREGLISWLKLAALPPMLWQTGDRVMLGISGGIFLLLCLGLLLWLKPLSAQDREMIGSMNTGLAKAVRWFARKDEKSR